MKILVLNGPNLNMLGIRDQNQYGTKTLEEINQVLGDIAAKENVELAFFQSNHEGALIDCIQKHHDTIDGILINPGALTHYSYSLRDALTDTQLPIVEVHLSDIANREDFRNIDVLEGIVLKRIIGLRERSYIKGLENLIGHIRHIRHI